MRTVEEVKEEMNEAMEKGIMHHRLNHKPSNGEFVKLEGISTDWQEHLATHVHLYSPEQYMGKVLMEQYLEEMIDLLPKLKASGEVSVMMTAILETLLLSLDRLLHPSLQGVLFSDEVNDDINAMFAEFNQIEKRHSFTTDANRYRVNKAVIIKDGDSLYAHDERAERRFIYMSVLFEETNSQKEKMSQLAHVWTLISDLSQNGNKVEYEDYIRGMREGDLHERTVYFINLVKRVLNWFFNSTSWRSNELQAFDEMEIGIKLGAFR